MDYKNQGRVLNDSHDGNIFNNNGLGIYRQNKYSDVERAVFSSNTRSKQAPYKLKDNLGIDFLIIIPFICYLASETYGNNFSNKSKGFKNIRESSAAKYNDVIVTKLLAGSNSAHTFKSASSHTSSLKNLNRDKLHSEDLYTNNLIEEQLHSSSSAETIAIKDKVSVQNSKKLKDYSGYKACNKSIEEIQRSKAYL